MALLFRSIVVCLEDTRMNVFSNGELVTLNKTYYVPLNPCIFDRASWKSGVMMKCIFIIV